MAKQISELTELTGNLDGDEEFFVVDDPGGSPEAKRISADNLFRGSKAAGQIYCQSGASSQSLSAGGWTKVTQFTAIGEGVNCTPDLGGNRITIPNNGYYLFLFNASFEGNAAVQHTLRFRWGSTGLGESQAFADGLGTGNPVNVSGSCIYHAEDAEQNLILEVMAGTSSTFVLIDGSLIAVRLF